MVQILKNPDLVAVIIGKDSVLCASLRKGTHKPFALHHHAVIQHPSIAQIGSLLHSTLIGNHIAHFIHKFRLANSFISIIAADQIVQEGFASTSTVSAHHYLQEHLTLPHTQLHTLYVGPYQERFLHWWHRINYPLIVQLHAIAYKHQLNIIRISSPFPLLLELYKTIRGSSFHPMQLVTDLEQHHFDFAKTYNRATLNSFLHHDQYLSDRINTDVIPLLIGAALYEEW